jgi:endonuclease YncB( thermonuclease family)
MDATRPRWRLWALWLVLALLGCGHGRTQTWTATVVHVSDGDTIYVRASGHEASVPVRLLGMDAPEICQSGGPASREALAEMVLQRQVTLVGVGQDGYGRELARVYIGGQDVGRALVAQGHAWSAGRSQQGGPYAKEQREARQARRGLFAQARPEPPRAFRQRHGSCHG